MNVPSLLGAGVPHDLKHPRGPRKPGARSSQNPPGPCRTAVSAGSAGSDRGPLRIWGPQGLCGRGDDDRL